MKLVTFTSSLAIAVTLANCSSEDPPTGPIGATTAPVASTSVTPSNTAPAPTMTMAAATMTMAAATSAAPSVVASMSAAPTGMASATAAASSAPPVSSSAAPSASAAPEPVCPNGMMEGTEACDDGNMVAGDGCENDCTETPEPTAITIEELVPDLEGHLVTTPCGDEPNSDDCAGGGWMINGGTLNVCQQGVGLLMDVEYPVGGVAGTVYDVAMHFYGVMEPRQYAGVTRDAMGGSSRDEGGMPTPWAWADPGAQYRSAGDNNYNTYEIHVIDEMGEEQKMYFLNSDSGTGHYTLAISYEKTIPVIGGGKVRLVVYDANCRMIKNCGPSGGPGEQCGNLARSVDIADADPQPGADLQQPGLGKSPQSSGQWWLIDVLSVAEAAAQ